MAPRPLVRWTIFDPTANETWTFEVNPNDGGTPPRKKSLQTTATAAPDGSALIFEGRDEVDRMEFSGTLLTESHLNALEQWFDKRHQVRLTDDLGRSFWVYLEEFTPRRRRSISHPWKHEYTVRAVILDKAGA